MNIGRLGSATYARDIILDFSLPVSIAFEESTTPDLVNAKKSTRIARASLVLYPFYVFDYVVDAKKGLLSRRRTVHEGRHTHY